MAMARRSYWALAGASVLVRFFFIRFSDDFNLGFRPEIATPVTSLRRLAEGYWLKRSSMSPYSGSMYHGSPLLMQILGPLTVKSAGSQNFHPACSLVFVVADLIIALLLRSVGRKLMCARNKYLDTLNLSKLLETEGSIDGGDIASLLYLWNPFTIITCVGSSTSPIDNLLVVLALHGACSRNAPLAAFGWVMATHISLYPVFLIVSMIFILGYGMDIPPPKLFMQCKNNSSDSDNGCRKQENFPDHYFSWRPVIQFLLWSFIWSFYVLILSGASLNELGGLSEMFRKTCGFILTVEDLSPNIGIFWYFFAEVFDMFRSFFLIVFHVNVLFLVLPLAIRLKHRPCFLLFVYVTISSMLKSYPSVADSALYLALMGLFVNELREMRFSFFLFSGYAGVSLLSPIMHNLWIWRGTGNANFYFATGIGYACLQTVLIVESVGTMLRHDRILRKAVERCSADGKLEVKH